MANIEFNVTFVNIEKTNQREARLHRGRNPSTKVSETEGFRIRRLKVRFHDIGKNAEWSITKRLSLPAVVHQDHSVSKQECGKAL